MFEIKIDNKEVTGMLERLAQSGRDMSPVMRAISSILHSQTGENIEAQGRPAWKPLSETSIELRKKRGTWPGQIMVVSAGGLASSYDSGYDPVSAWVGSNKKYARIQNMGGVTSPNSMIPNKSIPARPQVPITPSGNLQPETEGVVAKMLKLHFGG